MTSASRVRAADPPSDLAGCVMAVIHRGGPMTAYQVRQVFGESMTQGWRASAGSVYPLLKRLVAAGWVDGSTSATDRRGTQHLRLTDAGSRVLVAWLRQSDAWIADPSPDPIRTRSYVLGLLRAPQRRKLIATWREQTAARLADIQQRLATYADTKDHDEYCAHMGAAMGLQARVAWLDWLLEQQR